MAAAAAEAGAGGSGRPWRRGGLLGGGGAGVALGKFDGLHRGHAALAREAAAGGGAAGGWLVSFSGMAEALGWPPRLPLVAPPDRARVMAGLGVRELVLPFAAVRGLAPRDFLVGVLQQDLGVFRVCCGRNFRFGRGAAGDAVALQEICLEAGMEPRVLELLPTVGGGTEGGAGAPGGCAVACSSTGVRERLADGDVAGAAELLGRPHRLILDLDEAHHSAIVSGDGHLELAWDPEEAVGGVSRLLNQPPGLGRYAVVAYSQADEPQGVGHLELHEGRLCFNLEEREIPGLTGSAGVLGLDLVSRLD